MSHSLFAKCCTYVGFIFFAKHCKILQVFMGFFFVNRCCYVVWLFSLMQARSNNNLVGFRHTSSEVLLFNFQCFFCVVFLSSVAKKYKFSWFSFQIAKVTLMFCGIFTLKIMFLRVFSLGKVALTFSYPLINAKCKGVRFNGIPIQFIIIS